MPTDHPHEVKARYRHQAMVLATGFAKKLSGPQAAAQTVAMAHEFYLFLSEDQTDITGTLAEVRAELKKALFLNEQKELDRAREAKRADLSAHTASDLGGKLAMSEAKVRTLEKNNDALSNSIAEVQAERNEFRAQVEDLRKELAQYQLPEGMVNAETGEID